MNEEQKRILNGVSRWEDISFPNGSAYRRQVLPTGDHGAVAIRTLYNVGYQAIFADGSEILVAFDQTSVGPGVDLGEHYCSRDQALTELLP